MLRTLRFFQNLRLKNEALSLAALLFAASVLRFYHLGFQSLGAEELYFWDFVQGKGSIEFLKSYFAAPDFHPPFFLLILNILGQFFTLTEQVLRFPSAVAGLLSVFFLYKTVRFSCGHSVSILAASFWAFSGASIYYSQEARNYSLLVFLILWLWYCLERQWNSLPANNHFAAVWFVSIPSILSFYNHYMGGCAALMLIGTYAIRAYYDSRKLLFWSFLSTAVISVICFLPWAFHFFKQLPLWTISKPYNTEPELLNYFFRMFKFSFNYETFWLTPNAILDPKYLSIPAIGVPLLLLLGAPLFLKKKGSNLLPPTIVPLSLILVILPVVAIFLADQFTTKRYFYERNLLFILPFLYTINAYCLSLLPSRLLRVSVLFFQMGLMLFQPIVNQNYYSAPFKTEYKKLARLIGDSQLPMFSAGPEHAFQRYYLQKVPKPLAALSSNTLKGNAWILGHELHPMPRAPWYKTTLILNSFTGVWLVRIDPNPQ